MSVFLLFFIPGLFLIFECPFVVHDVVPDRTEDDTDDLCDVFVDPEDVEEAEDGSGLDHDTDQRDDGVFDKADGSVALFSVAPGEDGIEDEITEHGDDGGDRGADGGGR